MSPAATGFRAAMKFKIVSLRTGKERLLDLSRPGVLVSVIGLTLLLGSLLFGAGLQVGRLVVAPLSDEQLARALAKQRNDIEAVRGRLQGNVDALASRVGMMNAHLIRLDALGRRITDLANLGHGEFDFDKPPPAGGPEGGELPSGSAQIPDLAVALDALQEQLADRERQLTVLESLMSTRQLGARILPGGLPVIGGWISSHFGFRSDPITGHNAFHAGVDFAAEPGSKVIATGPGIVSFAGFRTGYGNVVEITHPTGYVTLYGHNSRNLVHEGDSVQKGQPIAIIGSTGRSTGTHVHFEVEQNGRPVNPTRYLGG
jgi:murein DD-endopeptidase MepM/ murein hydrolase activator NlpD